jgi:nucleotide-binding universal stress UspA family protein
MRRIFRTILYATDFSPASRPAFTKAMKLARAGAARLLLVHVLPPPTPSDREAAGLPEIYEAWKVEVRRDALRRLSLLERRARHANVKVRALLLEGQAHEEIGRAARLHRADLIVVGTHGFTGLKRVFLGSVADRILRTAPRPVLTVPPEKRAKGG